MIAEGDAAAIAEETLRATIKPRSGASAVTASRSHAKYDDAQGLEKFAACDFQACATCVRYYTCDCQVCGRHFSSGSSSPTITPTGAIPLKCTVVN